MDGTITGEDEAAVGLHVIDNNEIKHKIEMEFDGEIYYHEADYPDKAAERTDEDNEMVNQTRRFARYHVFVERGYETIPRRKNPVYLDAVRQAIVALSPEEFETQFGHLYQQLAHETGSDVDPVLEVPSHVHDPCPYCVDVYLGVDLLGTELGQTLADKHDIESDADSAADVALGDLSESEIAKWETVSEEFLQQSGSSQADLSEELYIDSTSDLYVKYAQNSRVATLDDHLEPAAREPDATIELLPMTPRSLEYFQEFLDYHLRCQIRDTFVMMGVHPPEEYRVLGLGRFLAMTQYSNLDIYPKLYESEIDSFS